MREDVKGGVAYYKQTIAKSLRELCMSDGRDVSRMLSLGHGHEQLNTCPCVLSVRPNVCKTFERPNRQTISHFKNILETLALA